MKRTRRLKICICTLCGSDVLSGSSKRMYCDDCAAKLKVTRVLAYKKRMYSESEAFREKYRISDAKRRLNNKEKTLLRSAKKRSLENGLDFNLTIEDIVIPEYCPVLGVPLRDLPLNSRHTPSIDRIDNARGYTKDNIQVISRKANSMKSDASFEELRSFANWVKTYLPS